MKSKVYFIPTKDTDSLELINQKIGQLLKSSSLFDFIQPGYNVAVKIHFGEEGNTGFVNPKHVRIICNAIKEKRAKAFLSDANTLYRGRRLNSKDHLKLALEHDFTKDITGVDINIPDDTKAENIADIEINQKYIKSAKIARVFVEADAIVAVNHFKGHILTGFGGALKNIGMGCATRQGKLAQHCDIAPVVHLENCTGCGECKIACPADAITIENNKSRVNKAKCIGCASCLSACPTMAMFIDFKAGDEVQMKIAEYSLAALKGKEKKSGYINFAININKECDCWGADNPRIGPDVGILASLDPVSIDKASLDLVTKASGKDIFKEAHPEQDGLKQLKYAQDLGLGSLDYELIEI